MAQRHAEMNWNKAGAKCLTNIPGMKCPLCETPLEVDVEHVCGRPPTGKHNPARGDAKLKITETVKKPRKR